MNQKCLRIAAVVICAVAGFVVGRISSQPPDGDISVGQPRSMPPGSNSSAPRVHGIRGPRAQGVTRTGKSEVPLPASRRLNSVDDVNSIIRNPNSFQRTKLWLEFVENLNPSDFKEVAEHCRGLREKVRIHNEYQMLLAAWLDHDPYAALDHLNGHAEYSGDHTSLMAAWATKDPLSAIRWAEGRPREHYANLMVGEVLKGVAASDPHRAAKMLDELSQPTTRERVMFSVMEGMSMADPKAAISYMKKINDPKVKSRALEGIVYKLSAIDPRTTLDLIDANSELVGDDVVRQLVWGSRTMDPVIGADAISRIENQSIRESTYQSYISQWLRRDYKAAVEWVARNDLPLEVRQSVDVMIERAAGRN